MRRVLALVLAVGLSCGGAFADDAAPAPPASDAKTAPGLDVFVPPDATNVLKHQSTDTGIMISYATALDHEGLVAFYRPLLEKWGWHFSGDFRSAQLVNYGLKKGDRGEGMLMMQRQHDQTVVLLTLKE